MRSGRAGTDRRALLPCRRSGKQQRRLDGKKARLDPDRQHRADCSPPTGPDPGRPLYGDRTARLVGEDRRSRRSDLRIPVLPRYRSQHHDDRPRCGGARTRAITDWGDARKTANRNRKTRPNNCGEEKDRPLSGTSELDGGVRHHPARGHLLRGIPERGRRARVRRTRENFHRKNSFHQPGRHPDRHRLQPRRGFSGPPAGRPSVRAARCGAPAADCRLAFPATYGRLAPSGGLRHRPSGRYGRDFNRQNSPGQS